MRWLDLAKPAVSFFLGATILVNEAFIQPIPDPTLLTLGGVLVGLPAVLGLDKRSGPQ